MAETSADNKVDIKSLFSEDDVDILGESAINSLSKVTERLVDAQVAPIRKELEDRKKSDAQRRKELAEFHQREQAKEFATRLANLVPNYEEIDTDPGFMEFLGEDDPVNGNKRFHWFKDAQANGNVGTVANYFREYEEITKQPERILENKITPTGNQGSGPPKPKGNPKGDVYPYSIWEQFHQDVVSGNFKGTEADRVALDKEFDRAYNEGRIDYTR